MDDRNQKNKVLVDYFKEKRVRVYEDSQGVLFCLYDIARYVGDSEYTKITKKYDDKLKLMRLYPVCGRKKEMAFLTIKGLMKYLTNFDEFMDHLIELMFNNNILLDVLIHPFSLLTTEQIDNIKCSNNAYVDQIEGSHSYVGNESQESNTLTLDQINTATRFYNGASCIYFIKLYATTALNSTKPIYKYGKTDNVCNRMKQYKGNPFSIEKNYQSESN